MKKKPMKQKLAYVVAASLLFNHMALVAAESSTAPQNIDLSVAGEVVQVTTTGSAITVAESDVRETTVEELKTQTNFKTGEKVRFTGTVTRKNSNNMYVQTEEAGILIYGSRSGSGADAKAGDLVEVEATTDIYGGVPQVKSAVVEVLQTDRTIEPEEITISEYNENPGKYEGKLIKLKGVTLGKVDTGSDTSVTDATGTANIYKVVSGVREGFEAYDVIAVGARYNSNIQLTVLDASDVIPVSGICLATESIDINEGDSFTLPKVMIMNNGEVTEVDADWNQEELDKVNTDKFGTYKVTGTYEDKTFTLTIRVNSDRVYKISEIQGAAHQSPLLGMTVKDIRGVVTMKNGTSGFYLQSLEEDMDDDEATSEGIYVSTSSANGRKVNVGDIVTVTGRVEENSTYEEQLTITQIYSNTVNVESSNNELPEPVIIGEGGRIPPNLIIDNDSFSVFDPEEDSIDFYESLEGMLVQLNEAQVTAANYNNDLPVVPNRGQYSLDLVSPQGGVVITEETLHPEILTLTGSDLPQLEVGDVFLSSVSGVMTYGGGQTNSVYKLLVRDTAFEIEQADYDKDPQTTLTETEDGLRIASFNVENLGGDEKDEKFEAIGKIIGHNMLFPDIIGLEEVQDNDGQTDSGEVSADLVYTKIIEAIKKQPGAEHVHYEYIEIAPENNQDGGAPGGNIRVGMLYRTDRVQLAEGTQGDAVTATGVVKGENGEAQLTLNPGRIAPTNEYFSSTRKSLAAEFIFNGKPVFVIANHLSSKGGDEALYGSNQPFQLHSEAKRIEQAKVVNEFVQDILEVNPQSVVVVLGDMNDYQFSNPLKALEGNELYNMHYNLPENERYTYIFQGKSQVLDNILVTKKLEACTDIEILHLNTIHSGQTQLSDHDPLLISIDMKRAEELLKPSTPSSPEDSSDSDSSDSSQPGGNQSVQTELQTGVTVKETNGVANVTISEAFVAEQLKDNETAQIVFEAKKDKQYLENMVISLDAKMMKALNESKKDFMIQMEEAQFVLPNGLVKNSDRLELTLVRSDEASTDVKAALPEARTALKAYTLEIKVNGKTSGELSKAVKVNFELPSDINKARLAVYVVNNGEYEYLGGTVNGDQASVDTQMTGTLVLAESTQTFADIEKHWAREAIEILAAKHLVIGTEANTFSPKAKMKAGDFATVLSRLVKEEVKVENQEALLTRAQMAVMIKEILNAEETVNAKEVLAAFSDVKDCTEEEQQALAYLHSVGILKGQSQKIMSPNTILTRAEMATVMIRVMNK